MTFNSVAFVGFLPIAFAAYWLVPARFRSLVLVAASYVFYGAWDVRLLPLLIVSTLCDFVVSNRLHLADSDQLRRRWLLVSLVVNLGLLGTFKYLGFFVDSAADVLGAIGFEPNLPMLSIVLPIGISFYTFQTMAYTIDVYRRRIEPVDDLLMFAAFVAFFPQLVAGPIERAERLLPQLRQPQPLSAERLETAARLFVRGLVLKLAIADSAAPIASEGFERLGQGGLANAVVAAVAFGVQIYGDFAGYTAMARGIAVLFGIDLVPNFAEPYLSSSITEFWRRWHMSLSQWLRDYLYIPLGGNRISSRRTSFNLMAVMTLGGLWHGAGLNFVAWGVWHGLWLMLERGRSRSVTGMPAVPDVPHILRTQLVVLFGWCLFRVESLGAIGDLFSNVATGSFGSRPSGTDMTNLLVLCGALAWFDITNRKRSGATSRRSVVTSGIALGAAAVALVITAGVPASPFVYFQF